MHDRHTNRERYFNEQVLTTRKHVIPFLSDVKPVTAECSVLEIGCGEGGNLVPFIEVGCERIVGIDLSEDKIESGKKLFEKVENGDRVELIAADIYDIEDLGQFDFIITRDVIEHIHDQDRFMEFVKKFLKPGGKFFLGFPPWHNPFGGHQQISKSKVLSRTPYYHILPNGMYRGILKMFKEEPHRIEGLMEIKETGISIHRFEKILKKRNYKTDKRVLYFINPNYETKFGMKPRKQWAFFSAIPRVRDFMMTCCYYIVSPNEN